MKRWISHPERYPYRCLWSHQESPDDGPYLDTGVIYFAARDIDGRVEPDRRESVLVISPQALIEAGNLPGSPIVVMPRWTLDAWESDLGEARLECERLEQDLADTQAALITAEQKLAEANDPEKIVSLLERRLDDRYARKPGPKPKAAA